MKIVQTTAIHKLDNQKKTELARLALDIRKMAYAPYSNLHVGAVVMTREGDIYSGVNIENASFGATVCAERVAIFKAISEGHQKDIVALAVASDQLKPIPPCGMCRQVLSELKNEVTVLMVGADGTWIEEQSSKLLPYRFEL